MFHAWRVAPLAPAGGLRPGHIRVLWADKLGWHSIVAIMRFFFLGASAVGSGHERASCQSIWYRLSGVMDTRLHCQFNGMMHAFARDLYYLCFWIVVVESGVGSSKGEK
jgi:hypothetical protein